MTGNPLISIVTPSYNQAAFIRETLQSLVDQDYGNLEVIIQDGGSTDGAVEIAREFVDSYPHIFCLYVEKDDGQADALNRGFARARGEILGFLNSDDTLYPKCLHRVAEEIAPESGRLIVMGRCLFTGEDSPYVGVEHPAEYVSHFDHLAIWKRGFNSIPQPSVFWHRQVWSECGGFDANEQHALDYDLFCRFSQRYTFHRVDELWSTYRMHPVSKSAQSSELEVLQLSIAVSRKYWGSWLKPLRWRCELSHWLHTHHHHDQARHHARLCEQAARADRPGTAFFEFWRTALHSPKMARDRLLAAWLVNKRAHVLQKLLRPSPQFTDQYGDGWIGPIYRTTLAVSENAGQLTITLQHLPRNSFQIVEAKLLINQKEICHHDCEQSETFELTADVKRYRKRTIGIEIKCNNSFSPHLLDGSEDKRKLSLQLLETKINSADGKTG